MAAPPISIFIVSMLPDPFMLSPPASKVTPFPAIRSGFLFFVLFLYSRIMSFGSWLLPDETAFIRLSPFFSICFPFRIVALIFGSVFAIFFAMSARVSGFISIAGQFT